MNRSNIAKHTICLIKILFLPNNLHLRISTCMYIYSSNQIPLIYYRLAVHVEHGTWSESSKTFASRCGREWRRLLGETRFHRNL